MAFVLHEFTRDKLGRLFDRFLSQKLTVADPMPCDDHRKVLANTAYLGNETRLFRRHIARNALNPEMAADFGSRLTSSYLVINRD